MLRTPRRVFLHVGAPKTGTTFLQSVLSHHRSELRSKGLLYPGSGNDHFHAVLDVLGRDFQGHTDPRTAGTWRRLVDEIAAFDGDALLSHEILSSAGVPGVRRVARTLAGEELHIIYTARDLARQLPAVWQELVKNRSTLTLDEFFARVREGDAGTDPHAGSVWRMQLAQRALEPWSSVVPPERVHLVTVPPSGADSTILWRRFAGVMGLDGSVITTTVGRGNTSLGYAEVEFIRELNGVLEDRVGWPLYASTVKFYLANDVLPTRPGRRAIELTNEQHDWCVLMSHRVAESIQSAGFDIVGDVEELVPARRLPTHPQSAAPSSAEVRDAAVFAVAGLLRRMARRESVIRELRRRGSEQDVRTRLKQIVPDRAKPYLRRAMVRLRAARPSTVRGSISDGS